MIGLADTSLFIGLEADRIDPEKVPDEVAVSVITVAELRLGVLMATTVEARHRRLSTLEVVMALEPVPIDGPIAETWAGLVASLRAQGRRMPLNDSWIAATALTRGWPVVTQDQDFDDVPGLDVVRV